MATVPAFPNQGSGSWYSWAQGVHDSVTVDLPAKEPYGGEAVARPLRNFVNKVIAMNSATGRVGWMSFGDSMASKVFIQVAPLMQSILGGLAGAVLPGPHSASITTNATVGTVTTNSTDFAHWIGGTTYTFSAGSSRTYGQYGGTMVCDTIKVIHVNAGGTFKIQIDGVDNTTVTTTTDNSIGITNLTVARGAHSVTIVQTVGTPTLVGVGMIDSTASGLVVINVGPGDGTFLSSNTTQSFANFQTFLADLAPTLMTFEMKEQSVYADSTTYAQRLQQVFDRTKAGAPNMDVVGIGSPPVATNDADQVAQNSTLRTLCEANGYTYYDTYALFGSYANMVALGWQGDGVHGDVRADQYRGYLMLRDLGLLNLPGRNILERATLPGVDFKRANDFSRAGRIEADASFGFDLLVMAARYFRIYDGNGVTERWRMGGIGDVTDFVPNKVRIGSTSGPTLNALGVASASLTRGDSTDTPADLTQRSYIASISNLAAQSGAITLDVSLGAVIVVNLTGAVTSWTFSNVPTATASGQAIEVHFVQDATGGRTLAGANAAIKLAGGTLTLSTGANKRDVIRFRQVGATIYEVSRSLNI